MSRAEACPRTEALPMAFTWGEFGRGLWWTLLCFNLGFPVSIVLIEVFDVVFLRSNAGSEMSDFSSLPNTVIMLMIICVPVSLVAAGTYGGAAAYGLGFLLRAQRHRWVHRVAFAVLGGLVGALAVSIFLSFSQLSATLGAGLWLAVIVAAVSVWAGWEITSRNALRHDARERANAAGD